MVSKVFRPLGKVGGQVRRRRHRPVLLHHEGLASAHVSPPSLLDSPLIPVSSLCCAALQLLTSICGYLVFTAAYLSVLIVVSLLFISVNFVFHHFNIVHQHHICSRFSSSTETYCYRYHLCNLLISLCYVVLFVHLAALIYVVLFTSVVLSF